MPTNENTNYSLRTGQKFVHWIRWFIRYSVLRRPKDMGRPDVEALLTMLATERKVAASPHRQALSALLGLYKKVLAQEPPWQHSLGY